MSMNQIGNGDEGVSVSSTPRVEAGGMATELIRLSRHLSNAAFCAERLASQFAKPLESATPTTEPSEALTEAATAKEEYGPAIGISRTAPEPASDWGSPIPVDGKRPEWLRDEDRIKGNYRPGALPGIERGRVDPARSWEFRLVEDFRLPASHPYYLATSRGFNYWPGGESAPEDWDGGEWLKRNGVVPHSPPCRWDWGMCGSPSVDVIGYRRKPEADVETVSERAASEEARADVEKFTLPRPFMAKVDGNSWTYGPFRVNDLSTPEDFGAVGYNPDADPLKAMVERVESEILRVLRDYHPKVDVSELGFTLIDAHQVIGLLKTKLIAQDKRLFEARTYDDAARDKAQVAFSKALDGMAHVIDGEKIVLRSRRLAVVDAIAVALGLQRACNAAAT